MNSIWIAQTNFRGYEIKATGLTKKAAKEKLIDVLPPDMPKSWLDSDEAETTYVQIFPGCVYVDSCWDEWAS